MFEESLYFIAASTGGLLYLLLEHSSVNKRAGGRERERERERERKKKKETLLDSWEQNVAETSRAWGENEDIS